MGPPVGLRLVARDQRGRARSPPCDDNGVQDGARGAAPGDAPQAAAREAVDPRARAARGDRGGGRAAPGSARRVVLRRALRDGAGRPGDGGGLGDSARGRRSRSRSQITLSGGEAPGQRAGGGKRGGSGEGAVPVVSLDDDVVSVDEPPAVGFGYGGSRRTEKALGKPLRAATAPAGYGYGASKALGCESSESSSGTTSGESDSAEEVESAPRTPRAAAAAAAAAAQRKERAPSSSSGPSWQLPEVDPEPAQQALVDPYLPLDACEAEGADVPEAEGAAGVVDPYLEVGMPAADPYMDTGCSADASFEQWAGPAKTAWQELWELQLNVKAVQACSSRRRKLAESSSRARRGAAGERRALPGGPAAAAARPSPAEPPLSREEPKHPRRGPLQIPLLSPAAASPAPADRPPQAAETRGARQPDVAAPALAAAAAPPEAHWRQQPAPPALPPAGHHWHLQQQPGPPPLNGDVPAAAAAAQGLTSKAAPSKRPLLPGASAPPSNEEPPWRRAVRASRRPRGAEPPAQSASERYLVKLAKILRRLESELAPPDDAVREFWAELDSYERGRFSAEFPDCMVYVEERRGGERGGR